MPKNRTTLSAAQVNRIKLMSNSNLVNYTKLSPNYTPMTTCAIASTLASTF